MVQNNASNGTKELNTNLKGISKEEISGQGILFFIAGFDTTNATFTHIFYYMANHSEWQDKLFEELTNLHEEVNYENLRNLPVLNAIINETLRLRPPLVVFERESIEDHVLEDSGNRQISRFN